VPDTNPPALRGPLYEKGFEVPSFDKGGRGRISQQVSQCTNVMWSDLDDLTVRTLARQDPELFLQRFAPPVLSSCPVSIQTRREPPVSTCR
jgi:hypothetical protein